MFMVEALQTIFPRHIHFIDYSNMGSRTLMFRPYVLFI